MNVRNVIPIASERRSHPQDRVNLVPRLIRLDRKGPVLVVLRPDGKVPFGTNSPATAPNPFWRALHRLWRPEAL